MRLIDDDEVEVARRRTGACRPSPRRSDPSWSDRSRHKRGPSHLVGHQVDRRGGRQEFLVGMTDWFTSATRSARKRMRRAQLALISRSLNAITVRVLPEPVAMTSRARRRWSFSNDLRRRAGWRGSDKSARRSPDRLPSPKAAESRAAPDGEFKLVLGQEPLDFARRDSAGRPRSGARSHWSRKSSGAGRTMLRDNRRRAWPAAGRRGDLAGALGLDEAQAACGRRPTAHSRRKPSPELFGMPVTLIFGIVPRLGEGPARLGQQQVDEGIAGGCLVVVVRIGTARWRPWPWRPRLQIGDLSFEHSDRPRWRVAWPRLPPAS